MSSMKESGPKVEESFIPTIQDLSSANSPRGDLMVNVYATDLTVKYIGETSERER